MTDYLLPRAPMTTKIQDTLAGALGIPFGTAAAPRVPSTGDASTLVAATAPYGVLYPLWRNLSGPPFGAANVDAEWVYQVTLIAERGDQADFLLDRVFQVFLGKDAAGEWVHPFDVPGLSVMDRTFKEDAGIDPADPAIGVFDAIARFGVHVTPVR
mgnify:CR=1 FL=1